jgi:hypothetical protein
MNTFDYHTPSELQLLQMEKVRRAAKKLHEVLLALPPCRERSIAITNLEQTAMWANRGVVMSDEGTVAE